MTSLDADDFARLAGLLGITLLVLSGIGGTFMAAKTAQRARWLRRIFRFHRAFSLIGAGCLLLHPVLFCLGGKLNLREIFSPTAYWSHDFYYAIGQVGIYAAFLVAMTSIFYRHLKRLIWRSTHFLAYVAFVGGLWHSLYYSGGLRSVSGLGIGSTGVVIILIIIAATFLILRVIAAFRNWSRKKRSLQSVD